MKWFAPIVVLLPLAVGGNAAAQTTDHMSMPGMSMPMPSAKRHTKPAAAAHARKPAKTKAVRHRRRHAAHAAPSMGGVAMQGPTTPGMATMPGMTMPPSSPHTAPRAGQAKVGMQMPNAAPSRGDSVAGMPGMTTSQPPAPSGAMADMPGMKGMDISGAPQGQATANSDAPAASEPEIPNTPPPPPPNDHAADRFFDPAAMAAARAQLRREHGGESWSMVMANLAEYQVRTGGGGYRLKYFIKK